MARRRGTGGLNWPLLAGSNDNPALALATPTTWMCNTVPDRCPTGPLAYILPFVLLTISGVLTQSGTAGSIIYHDQLKGLLIDTVDWSSCWHGTPVSGAHFKGVHLPIVEYVAGGKQFETRQRPPIPAAAGTYDFELTVAIPAGNDRTGDLTKYTSQLALLFQTSKIVVQMQPATVLAAASAGATFSSLTARLTARLEPTSELILGTPIETILHEVAAATNSPNVLLNQFGRSSMLNGVQDKGGVMYLAEVTNLLEMGGVFLAHNVTSFQFPWRGQPQCNHPQAMISEFLANSRPQAFPSVVAGGDSEFAQYPYINSNSDEQTTTSTLADLRNLLAWIIVDAGEDVQLTDLQTADNDQAYNLGVSGGFSAGSHRTIARYARAWNENMVNAWVGQITKGGANSLAAYVLGSQGAVASAKPRQINGPRHSLQSDQVTYLPWMFS